MRTGGSIGHEFVEYIPEKLKDSTLYVSMTFATAAHNCCCGCGSKVVTPISPTDWKLIFDGDTVSLYPSIGSWSFRCKSHYWIENGKVIWCRSWDEDEIRKGRIKDRLLKNRYFDKNQAEPDEQGSKGEIESEEGMWGRLFNRRKS